MIVMLELCQEQEIVPVVLLFIYKYLEVLVQLLVDSLCLSIYLKVPGYRLY